MLYLGPKSTIQGSKLASTLYTIYTLDIGKIQEIIKNREMYQMLTQREFPSIPECSQESVSYVDDLSQIIGCKNMLEMQTCLQLIYEITVDYFKANLLSINCSKTEILYVPFNNEETTEVYLMLEDGEFITSKSQVKILRVRFNAANDMSSHLSAVASCVGLAYKQLQPYLQHATLPQRKIILKSKVESIALYASPLMFNETESVKKRY